VSAVSGSSLVGAGANGLHDLGEGHLPDGGFIKHLGDFIYFFVLNRPPWSDDRGCVEFDECVGEFPKPAREISAPPTSQALRNARGRERKAFRKPGFTSTMSSLILLLLPVPVSAWRRSFHGR